MSSSRRRIPSLAAAIGIVWCLGLVWSPAAYAQSSVGLPDPSDAVGSVSDTVSNTVDSTVGSVGSIGDEVDEATGGATGVGGVVDTVTDVVSDAGDTVDETVGGGGEVVDETTDTISDTTGGATDPVTDVVDGVVDDVTDAVDGAVEGVAGGAPGPSTEDRGTAGTSQRAVGGVGLEPSLPGSEPGTGPDANRDGAGRAASREFAGAARTRLSGPATASQVALDAFARTVSPVGGALVEAATSDPAGAATKSPLHGVWEQAGELARRIAFPLALAFIVAGFLALQNRLDRHDPKLALAPVDQDQEVLHFD